MGNAAIMTERTFPGILPDCGWKGCPILMDRLIALENTRPFILYL